MLNSTIKNITGKVVSLAMRGQRQGLSWFGESVDGVARFLVFAANTERRSFIYRPENRNESLSGPTASARAVTIYDVGANNGDDVDYYLKKSSRVVAIEANPALAESLRSRFRESVQGGRLVVLNLAVAAAEGSAKLYVSDENHLVSTLLTPPGGVGTWREVTVKVTTLSAIIKEFGEPKFVKVDVEGSESAILHELFSSCCKPQLISAESHSIEVFCEFVSAGYRKFKVVEGMILHHRFQNWNVRTIDGSTVEHTFPKWTSSGPFGDDLPGDWMTPDETFHYLCEHGLGWKDIHASL